MPEYFAALDADIPEGGRKVVAIEGVEIGIFRVDGALRAWRNECPHQGGPVCQGRIMPSVEERLDEERKSLGIHYKPGSLNVVCPWHGYEFDIRSGTHAGLDRIRLVGHPVTVRNGEIFVTLRG